jgi:hypothetical protein
MRRTAICQVKVENGTRQAAVWPDFPFFMTRGVRGTKGWMEGGCAMCVGGRWDERVKRVRAVLVGVFFVPTFLCLSEAGARTTCL